MILLPKIKPDQLVIELLLTIHIYKMTKYKMTKYKMKETQFLSIFIILTLKHK